MTIPADPKKPRTTTPAIRRKQLVAATINCIARSGISGTTLAAIAKEAGVSLGLANFHFKSKDILLSETLKHLAEEHREMWMRDLRRSDLTSADKLRSIITAQFHASICSRKKLSVWFAFFGETAHRKSYRSITSQIDMERQELCTELLEDIIKEGDYVEADAENIALTLEGMFDGLWLNMLMYPAKFTREKATHQVLNYLEMFFPRHFIT